MGTFVVGMIVLGIVISIISVMVKNKKAGKSIQCGCDCNQCKRNCH